MSEPQKFHPLSLVITLFKVCRATIFIPFFFIIKGESLFVNSLTVIGYLLLVSMYCFIIYWTTRYNVTSEHIQTFKGVFNKKIQTIPYERIQTINQNQWFFLKPFHLVELSIDTATKAGGESEVHLTTVPEKVLLTIEGYRKNQPEITEDQALAAVFSAVPPKNEKKAAFFRIRTRDIFIFAATDLRIIATALVILSFINNIHFRWFQNLMNHVESYIEQGTIILWGLLIFLSLLLTVCISIINYFIRYYNFTVERTGQQIRIESGLFKRRTQVIDVSKIQAIRIKQQLLRQVFKLATIELLILGDMKNLDSELTGDVTFFPILSFAIAKKQLSEFLPEFQFPETPLQHVTKGKLSSNWYFMRWSLLWFAFGGASFVLCSQLWTIGIGCVLCLIHAGLGFYRKSNQAYALSDHLLTIQTTTFFTKKILFAERRKIQAFSLKTSKWLVKKKVGHINAMIPSGISTEIINLKFMPQQACHVLVDFYRQKRLPN